MALSTETTPVVRPQAVPGGFREMANLAYPVVLTQLSATAMGVVDSAMVGRLGATELMGTLMVVVIVRELGPLLTALAVAGRSGTAMAAELATNRVMGEIDALEGMGIDPVQYLVLPRFLGATLSVFCLIVVFDLVAVAAGLAAALSNGMTSPRYFDIVFESLTFRDAWVTVVKGLAFGIVIGTVPSFHGLRTRRAATQVPIAAGRAVVASILGIFILSAVFVAVS